MLPKNTKKMVSIHPHHHLHSFLFRPVYSLNQKNPPPPKKTFLAKDKKANFFFSNSFSDEEFLAIDVHIVFANRFSEFRRDIFTLAGFLADYPAYIEIETVSKNPNHPFIGIKRPYLDRPFFRSQIPSLL